MKNTVISLALVLAAGAAAAQETPVGLWKTIDDDGKTEKSLVRIADTGGVLTGRIEKLLAADAKPDAKCDKCTDERKDQPLVGLAILRNLKRSADDVQVWEGGEVLDPKNGKNYRTRLKTVDGGKKLEMRGYIGPFYRTQTWIRVE